MLARFRWTTVSYEQECALDFTFGMLGITSEKVEQPIIMTERLANPLFSRASMSILSLFPLEG
jgi:actin-related protein 5